MKKTSKKLDDQQLQREFIERNWSKFVYLSQEGYKAEGRGAVLVHAGWATGHGKDNQPAMYLGERNARSTRLGWPDEKAAEMVRSYDPQSQMVVIFVDKNNDIFCHKLTVLGYTSENPINN